ncbi:MAG: porin [Bacteroidales bacterium]
MRYTVLSLLFGMLFFVACPVAGLAQTDEDVSVEMDDMLDGDDEPLLYGKAFHPDYYTMGSGLSFLSDNDSYGLNLSGYVQSTFHTQRYPGDNTFYSRFRVRRARIRLNGNAMRKKIRYRLGLDLVKGSETDADGLGSMLSDAWFAYHPWGNNRLSIAIGQRSTPTDNRELQMNSAALQLVERSKLTSAFGTIREVGVFLNGTYKVGTSSYLRPALAVTDGDGPISGGRRYGGLKYGARVNYLPFGLFRLMGESRESDMAYEVNPKLSLGIAYSYTDGVSDRRGGREGGAILYQNADKKTDLPDMGKLTADFLFKYRGFSMMGEFVKTWGYVPGSIRYRVRNDGTVSSDFTIDGENNVTNYIKNRMMIGSGVNLQAGYFFRGYWSVDARYTRIMPDKYSYLNNDLYYKRSDYYDVGLTKYLTKSHAAKVQANVGFAKSDGTLRKPDGETFDGWEKSVTILFQLAF